MMALDGGALTIARNGRTTTLQRVTAGDRYTALCRMGVKESVAAGVAKGLLFTKVKAG